MKVSAVLATYNGARYIPDQLRSILNQTRAVDEVIIRDDGSTDGTIKLVQDFIESNGLSGSWHLTVNEQTLGYAENFRHAMDDARGDLLYLSDQDDVWVENRVEMMTYAMDSNPQIGLLNTTQVFFSGATPTSRSELTNGTPRQIPLTPYTRFQRYPGCTMCVRRTFYEEIAKYWYTGWAHDEFLWCVSVLCGRCYEWEYCSLLRRRHDAQVSGHLGHSRDKRIAYLRGELACGDALIRIAEERHADRTVCNLYRKNRRTTQDRLDLIQQHKLTRAVRLLCSLKYYYSPRSYWVELKLAFERR